MRLKKEHFHKMPSPDGSQVIEFLDTKQLANEDFKKTLREERGIYFDLNVRTSSKFSSKLHETSKPLPPKRAQSLDIISMQDEFFSSPERLKEKSNVKRHNSIDNGSQDNINSKEVVNGSSTPKSSREDA